MFPVSWISCHTFHEAEYDLNWTAKALLAQDARKHVWPQTCYTWDGLRSHFTHTILSCQIYVKADEINLLHWISCFERSCVFCWCDLILLELWQKWDLSQGPRCGSSHCASCCGAGSAHLGEGTWCQGSHGNSCGAEDPDITGSVAQEQAAKPLGPRFSFGTKPGFLNPNILH